MAETQKKDAWVRVVDADGNLIPGNPSVPEAWLGTSFLPEGARRAPELPVSESLGEADVFAQRVAELEAREAAVAEQEKALAEREAAVTAREAAAVTPPEEPKSPRK